MITESFSVCDQSFMTFLFKFKLFLPIIIIATKPSKNFVIQKNVRLHSLLSLRQQMLEGKSPNWNKYIIFGKYMLEGMKSNWDLVKT